MCFGSILKPENCKNSVASGSSPPPDPLKFCIYAKMFMLCPHTGLYMSGLESPVVLGGW